MRVPIERIPPSKSSKTARQAGFNRGIRKAGNPQYTSGPVRTIYSRVLKQDADEQSPAAAPHIGRGADDCNDVRPEKGNGMDSNGIRRRDANPVAAVRR